MVQYTSLWPYFVSLCALWVHVTTGKSVSSLFDERFGERSIQILMVGLNGAGKTTLLNKMELGEIKTTILAIGFSVETVEYRNISFISWDLSGQNRIRPMWRHYIQSTQVIIYVVDSNDRERVLEARSELTRMLGEDDLRGAILLLLTNKQDLPDALSMAELTDGLALHSLRNRRWFMQGTCATNGTGLYEGLEWMATALEILD